MYEDLIAFTPNEPHAPFQILMSGISYCDGTYKISRPNSPLYCFEYIYKGKGMVHLNQAAFPAKAGDIYILPAGQNHWYYADGSDPWTKIWFNISGSLVEKLLDSYQIKHIVHLEGLDLSELFQEFLDTARAAQPQEQIFNQCALIFLRMVQEISRHVHAGPAENIPLLARQLKEQLDELTDFSIAFGTLTSRLYCTKSHAIRVFKAAYGITPYQYLLQKKLSLAKMMLEGTQLSIQEISASLGFRDSHYFSSFFKREAGVSPQKFRRERPQSE